MRLTIRGVNLEIITSHTNADFDAFASMVAASLIYPDAQLVFAGSQEKDLRNYLTGSNLDFGLRKLKDIELAEVTRLIVVDTCHRERLGPFAELIEREDVEVIVYDHHVLQADELGAREVYAREYGANTTLMIRELQRRKIKIAAELATLLAAGIYEDTGGLLFPSTAAEDVEAFALCLKLGADTGKISRLLSRELSADQVDVLDQLIKNVSTSYINGIHVLISHSVSPIYVDDYAMLAHKLERMYKVDAIFTLGRMGDVIYLVARSSLPQLDAAEVAAVFGGGGHATAAAASIRDISLDEAIDEVLAAVRAEARPRITARDIMTFPVKGLEMDASIDEASQMLNRYHINSAVVWDEGQVAGYVTRQVVTRAQGHVLGKAKVCDYMIRDFECVDEGVSLGEVRSVIVDGNQRLLPVMRRGKLVGVITRTDILSAMHEKMGALEGSRVTRRRSVRALLRDRLPGSIYDQLYMAGELANEMNYKLYLVGGIVRDILLRIDNLDIDLVVEGDGIVFARSLAAQLQSRLAVHDKYKTAVLKFEDGNHIDIATARLEYYKRPGGFPVVEESTLKLDLYRRDFTINTMAICLNPDRFGELVDFFGAQNDMKEGRIRVLHSLSFVEDPSRMLRGVRFEQRFDFKLGKQTRSLIKTAVKSGLLSNLPGKRIAHELKQMLSEEDPVKGMQRLHELGILQAIDAETVFSPKVVEDLVSVRETVAWFNLLYTHEKYAPWQIYVLALIEHQESGVRICQSMGLDENDIRRIVLSQQRANDALKQLACNQDARPSQIVDLLAQLSLEELLYVMSRTKCAKETISSYITSWRRSRPLVRGRDLMEIGFTQGPLMGECLNLIRDKSLNGELGDFSAAIAFAEDFLRTQD